MCAYNSTGFWNPYFYCVLNVVNIFGVARTWRHKGLGVRAMSLGLHAMVRKTTLEDKQWESRVEWSCFSLLLSLQNHSTSFFSFTICSIYVYTNELKCGLNFLFSGRCSWSVSVPEIIRVTSTLRRLLKTCFHVVTVNRNKVNTVNTEVTTGISPFLLCLDLWFQSSSLN